MFCTVGTEHQRQVREAGCSDLFTGNLNGYACLVKLRDAKVERSVARKKRPVQFDQCAAAGARHLPFALRRNMLSEEGSVERLGFLISKLAQSVPGSQKVGGRDEDVEITKLPESHVCIELLSENGTFVSQNLNII